AAARIRQWALSDTELAPEDARAVWEATVGLADRSRRRCPAPKPILAALRRITDGELEPEVRRHELVLWRGRAGEPPATARKWAGSAEYRVPRPGRPDRYRILVHPSGRVGYSTDHYRRIREFHPGGGCDCAGGQRR
ncbi:MAG TPA: hypothetical protein VFY17_05310, partial [Pilimelia sp.]|nr:hypothetical protein [Pilimelia sp.]